MGQEGRVSTKHILQFFIYLFVEVEEVGLLKNDKKDIAVRESPRKKVRHNLLFPTLSSVAHHTVIAFLEQQKALRILFASLAFPKVDELQQSCDCYLMKGMWHCPFPLQHTLLHYSQWRQAGRRHSKPLLCCIGKPPIFQNWDVLCSGKFQKYSVRIWVN